MNGMDINSIVDLNKNRYLRNFDKDKKLIFTVILIILVWSLVYLFIFYKPSYKSKAQIWIKDLASEEFVADFDTRSQLTPLTSSGNPLLTQIEILKSNQLKKFIVDYSSKPGYQKAKIASIESVDKIIEVKNKPGTDMLSITFIWSDPKEAQELLNAVLKEYENINLLINKKIRTARRKYIDLKLSEIDKKLYETRSSIKSFKSKNLAINLDEESVKLVDQKIEISSKMEDLGAKIKNTDSSVKNMETRLGLNSDEALDAVALGAGNQVLVKLREDLNTAVQQYEYDSSKYTDINPKINAQKKKIDAINIQIKNQIKMSLGKYAKDKGINIFDPVREQIVENLVTEQAKLIGLQAEEASIKNSINNIKEEQSKIPEKKFALDTLEQEERALSKAYDELREKQIEARIKEAEAVSNVVVVDPPDIPKGISFPTPLHVLVISLILGCFAGLSVSILKTLIEDICDDIESIESITQTSIIGTIPWVKNIDRQEKSLFIHEVAYNNIVSNLIIRCNRNNTKVLTFASASLKKPQSSILYYLAEKLGKIGHSVVIVDSDFRKPIILKSASVDHKVKFGFSDLIISLETEYRKTNIIDAGEILEALVQDERGINYLGNSEAVFEPYEFFGTLSFETVIKVLKDKFDWVLINTGAAHITPEFLIVSKLSDGVILFANRTITYTVLKNIVKTLKNAGIPIIGTIVREYGSKLEKEYEKYLSNQEFEITDENIREALG